MARVVGPGFHEDVAQVVRRIPPGRLSTFGDLATALGAKSVARHVGWALSAMTERDDVPWHRVINARGRLPQPTNATCAAEQRSRLIEEGVVVDEEGRVPAFAGFRMAVADLQDKAHDGGSEGR